MIVDRLENWRRRFGGPAWTEAFVYLEGIGAETRDGETPIRGEDIFARVMSYETKTHEEAVLESHRRYVDIQMSLVHAEGIEWFPAGDLEIIEPYDETKDVTFYRRPGPAPARADIYPGTFAVLFPEDAHMPQLVVGEERRAIKKVVVKVLASLVEPGAEVSRA